MKNFKVDCTCLYWVNNTYIVEAESEEDIDEGLILESGEIEESWTDSLDQINSIDSIEEIC